MAGDPGLDGKGRPSRTIFHPGHGDPGRPDLLAAQSAYIHAFRESVRRNAPGGGPLDARVVREIQQELFRIYPADRLGFLVSLGVDVVAAELSLEAARAAITDKLTGR